MTFTFVRFEARDKKKKFYFAKELTTRYIKLSYRKDDRAMRPIYGYPEKFRES